MGDKSGVLLEWSSTLELGVEQIDLQHHYFLNLINRLNRALHNGDDHSMQVALLSELNAYVKFHFISEENMMRFANYDKLSEHQQHHYELIDKLNAKESGLNVRYNEEEARAVLDFLVHWFKSHTTEEDKQFADFLHRQRGA